MLQNAPTVILLGMLNIKFMTFVSAFIQGECDGYARFLALQNFEVNPKPMQC